MSKKPHFDQFLLKKVKLKEIDINVKCAPPSLNVFWKRFYVRTVEKAKNLKFVIQLLIEPKHTLEKTWA